jgi:ABC-2 type transport system permease protein
MEPSLITLKSTTTMSADQGFNWLAYSAPSMAILFLMFAVANGGRTILAEREGGTLPRMLVTPTTGTQVMAGKVTGIFLTGLAQMLVLFLASRFLFDLSWGEPTAVLILTICLCAAATSWGVLIAAAARTPGQVGMASTAVTLIFAAVAGNFFPRSQLPAALQTVSLISPNAWGLEGFTRLMSGGGLAEIYGSILALIAMALILFLLASLLFRRQYSR